MIGKYLGKKTAGGRGILKIDSVTAQFDKWASELMQGKSDIAEQMVENNAAMKELQIEQDLLEQKAVEATNLLKGIEALKSGAFIEAKPVE